MDNTQKSMEKLVALCKGRGFIYPGSEIYGGLANTWDYGPLGIELKNNIKAAWWKKFVRESPYNVGLDSGILMNPAVWQASGHLKNFNDPLMDCRKCKNRYRADHLIEAAGGSPAGMSFDQMSGWMAENGVVCPDCGSKDFTSIRQFNMMFKTFQGVNEDTAATIYLRPETAQGIFVQFKNILRTTRKKMPFGVAQIGKSFRNEITPGNFIFRTREFEQMEMEFFCKPGTDLEWFAYWKEFCKNWLLGLGMREENLKLRDHEAEELSHYSNATTDFEFLFPFGWGELWGVADRTDFDLKSHQAESGENMEYFDPETNEKYIPYVIEPALGVDRMFLAFLVDAYDEEEIAEGDVRTVLRLHPALAPVKCAVLPLSKKLGEEAAKLYANLQKHFSTEYDETGSIGKRYRRQDEIGTLFCVTYDFDSQEDNCVTVRDRDTMKQERIPAERVAAYIGERLAY
ncbi:MAG: glycine--tRNA ligase [Oscillospiraceae bacterium]|nr:glycine--tRNA ligase [Oscillospiraceae bacterium]